MGEWFRCCVVNGCMKHVLGCHGGVVARPWPHCLLIPASVSRLGACRDLVLTSADHGPRLWNAAGCECSVVQRRKPPTAAAAAPVGSARGRLSDAAAAAPTATATPAQGAAVAAVLRVAAWAADNAALVEELRCHVQLVMQQ